MKAPTTKSVSVLIKIACCSHAELRNTRSLKDEFSFFNFFVCVHGLQVNCFFLTLHKQVFKDHWPYRQILILTSIFLKSVYFKLITNHFVWGTWVTIVSNFYSGDGKFSCFFTPFCYQTISHNCSHFWSRSPCDIRK